MNRLPLALALLMLAAACAAEEAPPGETPSPILAPIPPPQQLPEGAHITRDGVYILEAATGRLWRLEGGGPWSPDGGTLIATACCVGTGGLDLVAVPDGPAVRIYGGDVAGAAWSPDGRQIAFSPSYASGPGAIFIIDRDGASLRQIAEEGTWDIRWSPSGRYLAYDTGEAATLLDLESGRLQPLGKRDFAWSPDGESLALAGDEGLELYNPDTGERHMVAVGPATGPLLWSPDGTRIILRYGDRIAWPTDPQATYQLSYIAEVSGGAEPVLLGDVRWPAWSPDGQRIVYLNEGCTTGDWNVYVVPADLGARTALTASPGAAKEGPAVALSGSNVAFSTFERVTVVHVDSGETVAEALLDGWPEVGHLHLSTVGGNPWSPDGRYLVFSVAGGHGICD